MMEYAQRTGAMTNQDDADTHSSRLPETVSEEVVRFYAPMIYRLALTRMRATAEAEDIFQEVFLKLLDNRKPFASEEHRKAWLIRVTINCCHSHFVAPWRRNVVSLEDVGEPAAEMTEPGEDVYARVLTLPGDMKDAVILFYYEGMSVRDIADATGAAEATVKKRLSRARQKLKLEITEEGGDHRETN